MVLVGTGHGQEGRGGEQAACYDGGRLEGAGPFTPVES